MTRQRHLRWGLPERPVPKHPYRDSLLVYGFFAVLIVVLAWVTGGSLVRAIVVAALVWAAASLWSIVSWRRRLRHGMGGNTLSEDDLG